MCVCYLFYFKWVSSGILRYGRDVDLYIRSTMTCSMQEVSSVRNSFVLPGDGPVGLEHMAGGVL